MIDQSVRRSIAATLAYFDLFDFPLTALEVYQYLWQAPSISLAQCQDVLTAMMAQTPATIASQDGWFFLAGREAVVAARQRRVVYSEFYLLKARAVARLLRYIPFIRSVCVANSVGRETATGTSDIDLVILCAPGRVWWVRFWCNTLLRLTGQRVSKNSTAGKVCLCFFADTDHLDLGEYRVAQDDIHFCYWLYQMHPVYDPRGWYAKFLAANTWSHLLLPNARGNFVPLFVPMLSDSYLSHRLRRAGQYVCGGTLGKLLERSLRLLQMRLLRPAIIAKAQARGTDVVLAAGVIKLHDYDTRREWRERWVGKLAEFRSSN